MLDMRPLIPTSGRTSATSNPESHLKLILPAAPKFEPARPVSLSEIRQGRMMLDIRAHMQIVGIIM